MMTNEMMTEMPVVTVNASKLRNRDGSIRKKVLVKRQGVFLHKACV